MKRKAKANTSAPVSIAEVAVAPKKERFVFRVTEHESTYLHVGDVVMVQGREQVVRSVNATCARVIPITEGTAKKVKFKPRFSETPVEFVAPERNSVVSISANSELEIKRRLGVNWKERL